MPTSVTRFQYLVIAGNTRITNGKRTIRDMVNRKDEIVSGGNSLSKILTDSGASPPKIPAQTRASVASVVLFCELFMKSLMNILYESKWKLCKMVRLKTLNTFGTIEKSGWICYLIR